MGRLRTKPVKGVVIFASIAILASIGAAVAFIIDRSSLAISIIVYVFAGLFFIFGILTLIDQLFHYVEVKENDLISKILFVKKQIPIEKIKKITMEKGIYQIYTKKGIFCTIPSQVLGASEIIVALSRRGKDVENKDK